MTTTDEPVIFGSAAPGFEGVGVAFRDNFSRRGDLGAACSVYRHGLPVVDLWGGWTDSSRTTPWSEGTTVPVFSATKGALMTCVHLLIERGALDAGTPVAAYWSDFGANGKSHIPLSWMMSHQAGIPVVDAQVTLGELADWPRIVHAVARQTPSWTPGSAHGYHPRTIGWVLGELIRQVSGDTPGQFFAKAIAEPLNLEWSIGTPRSRWARLATLAPPPAEDLNAVVEGGSLQDRAFRGPSELFAYDGRWNRPEYLEPEIPSSNGVASARAIARLYASLIGAVDGIRILSAPTLDRATRVGFSLFPSLGRSCPPGAFGHPGAGGSLGFADPTAAISFGYVTNQIRLGDHETERADALVQAVYDALSVMPASSTG